MGESFEFREATHFTAGAIGTPGNRVFYLQAGDGSHYVSVKVEKQQVVALAGFLRTVLDDLPTPDEPVDSFVALIEPALPEWVVGQIAVGVDEAASSVVIVVEELSFVDEDEDDDDPLGLDDLNASLRVQITPAQAEAFIATTDILLAGGRPPCRLCGQPEDPGGHACPRLN
ncbi:MAG: DUF3090 family protein [Acidimicrobiales bacterium]